MMTGGVGAFEHRFLSWDLSTDEAGAFLFSGLVPGSEARIAVFSSNDISRSKMQNPEVREFNVRGPEPINLSNIVVAPSPAAK
jgi:hypothetical protein